MKNSLQEHREQYGLSQRELAEHVGVTRQTINAVEGNRYDPSVELVFKLAAFFECSVEDVFHPDVDVATTASHHE
ncbi:helix-turn-helix transcriptional regulator [Halorientalis regularis]|jgi:putative transcriptional regulator|uniref:Putative transcriptional regulator n=1 Tax=Halorientalis regularis TaxID=660518 RepID=A0A1G7SUS1_9EURY|nr:helix-turn-helix transcriptional regulator [Halorientalis regularis]SDG26030.1 putative transcriptional regulator [Halorientalis regularis]